MAQVDRVMDKKIADMTDLRKRKGGDVAAIFVHAGAGFHSVQNEHVHLAVCAE